MDERNSAAERASGRNERGRKQIPGLHSSAADVSGVGCAERHEGVGVFPIFIIEDILEDFAAAMQRNGNALRLTITDRRNINLNTYTYEKKTIMRNSRFSIHYRFDLLRCRPNL